MAIVNPLNANPLCSAVVDLVSRVQRPFLWRVSVTGLPPHAYSRIYDIPAATDGIAARAGIQRFVEEFSRPIKILSVLNG